MTGPLAPYNKYIITYEFLLKQFKNILKVMSPLLWAFHTITCSTFNVDTCGLEILFDILTN